MIAELDEKKREALQKTWLKVNQDFGSIFATLLPGTSAKLEPPEGQSFLAGAHALALGMQSHALIVPPQGARMRRTRAQPSGLRPHTRLSRTGAHGRHCQPGSALSA